MTNYKSIDLSDRCLVSEEAAKEFIDHRINLKSKLTQRAFKRAMMTASEAPNKLNMPPDWAVEETIDAGWKGIKLEWLISRLDIKVTNGLEPASTRSMTLEQELNRGWAHNPPGIGKH